MNLINKYILFLFSFFLLMGHVKGQNKKIDSLKSQLKAYKKSDTIRVKLLLAVVDKNYKKEYENNIKYLKEAETISKDIRYKKGVASSLFYKGLITLIKSKYNSGYEYYEEAISLYKELNMYSKVLLCYRNLSISYSNKGDFHNAIHFRKQLIELKDEIGNKNTESDLFYIGWYYYRMGKFDECIPYYDKALLVSEQNNNHEKFQDCLTAIGNLYSHQGNYTMALEYLNRALDSAKKYNSTKNISDVLVSLGNVYIRLQDYDRAITYHKDALKKEGHKNYATISHNLGESYKYKKDYDRALTFFVQALEGFRKNNNRTDEAVTLNKIGEVYFELKKEDTAYQYFEKAKNINIKVENLRGLSGSHIGLTKVYFKKENFHLALKHALKCKEIAENLGLLDIQRDAQQLLFNIYKNTGNYKKAFESHQQFKIFNDSIFNKGNTEKIAQLEAEYKYKQAIDSASIRELKLTKTVLTTSQNLEKSQRNLFLGIIAFLITGLILGTIIFFLKLRNEKSKTQNAVIEQKLLRSQMTPHFIFNSLSVLQGMILNKEEKKSVNYLSKFSRLLRITLENSRDKMVLLSQELKAINNYLALQNLENQAYDYTVSVAGNIDASLFKIPPMLIQPFIENAIEHAFVNQEGNRRIDVQLAYSNKELTCAIIDNGIGVDALMKRKNQHKKSLSTTITSERLQMLSKDFKINGSVVIEDRKKYNEQGTIVTLIIPHKALNA